MVSFSPLRVLALLLVSATCLACSDPWVVVNTGQAEAFKGKTSFMFDAPGIGGSKIDGGTEEEYIEAGDDLVELWNRGKKSFLKRFPAAMTTRLGEKGITIGPGPTIGARVENIVVGELYTVDDNPNYLRTEITMVITITDGDTKSDEVRITQSAHGFATKPVELRFGAVGDGLGLLAAEFVASRSN